MGVHRRRIVPVLGGLGVQTEPLRQHSLRRLTFADGVDAVVDVVLELNLLVVLEVDAEEDHGRHLDRAVAGFGALFDDLGDVVVDSGAASPLVAVPAVHDGVQPSRVAVRGRAEAEFEPDHRAEVVRGECDGGGVGALEVPRRRAVVGERAHERLKGARPEVERVGVLRVVDRP